MMFNDGHAIFYIVQHRWMQRGQWTDSNLAGFMFERLSPADSRGTLGDHYRSLIAEQGASTALWQTYGINGFASEVPAKHVLAICQARNTKHSFRLVRRQVIQVTEVIDAA